VLAVTSAVALIVALCGLLSTLIGLIGLFRKVQQVHVLVNAQLSTVMRRVDQLTGTLQTAGIQVPDKPHDDGGESGEHMPR
jgi:uncharacterized membrane protein (UPF0136 family)